MTNRYRLDGRPLRLVSQIMGMYGKSRAAGESRRAWGVRLGALICELATQTSVEPMHLKGHLPDSLVAAVLRERVKSRLNGYGTAIANS